METGLVLILFVGLIKLSYDMWKDSWAEKLRLMRREERREANLTASISYYEKLLAEPDRWGPRCLGETEDSITEEIKSLKDELYGDEPYWAGLLSGAAYYPTFTPVARCI